MLLTNNQKRILEVLQKCRVLRAEQLVWYCRLATRAPEGVTLRELRQLRVMGCVTNKAEYWGLPQRKPDVQMLDAFDVMHLLSEDNLPEFATGNGVYKLLFFVFGENGKKMPLSLCRCHPAGKLSYRLKQKRIFTRVGIPFCF